MCYELHMYRQQYTSPVTRTLHEEVVVCYSSKPLNESSINLGCKPCILPTVLEYNIVRFKFQKCLEQ